MQNECCIKGCTNKEHQSGMCHPHWRRLKLYGSPMRTKQSQFHGLTLEERFFKWVKKTDGGCWLWIGSTNKVKPGSGAGQIRIKGRKNPVLAHRISWEIHKGPIPEGMNVCHSCDNPPCVNPDHLFLGSQSDNLKDMFAKGRNRNQFSK